MKRRLTLLLVILAALILSYVILMRVAPPPDSQGFSGRATASEPPPGAGPYPAEYDELTVTIDVPGLDDCPPGWAQTGGCPHRRVSQILRAAIGPGNGVPVLDVDADGPAAEAGIRQGDRLGPPGSCVSSMYESLAPKEEPRTVEWTVRRPKADDGDSFGAEDAAPPPSPEGPTDSR